MYVQKVKARLINMINKRKDIITASINCFYNFLINKYKKQKYHISTDFLCIYKY